MTDTTYTHICVSIPGLQRHLEAQDDLWQILSHEDGRPLSFGETWAELYRCQNLGYDCIPSGECDNRDKKGHCLGHKTKVETKVQTKMPKFGDFVVTTADQNLTRAIPEIPIGTKCVVIEEVDLPAYDLLVVPSNYIFKYTDEDGNEQDHRTVYLLRGTWRVL